MKIYTEKKNINKKLSGKWDYLENSIISSYIFAFHFLIRKNSKIWLKELSHLIIVPNGITDIKCELAKRQKLSIVI
jgi:hypothetical protein